MDEESPITFILYKKASWIFHTSLGLSGSYMKSLRRIRREHQLLEEQAIALRENQR